MIFIGELGKSVVGWLPILLASLTLLYLFVRILAWQLFGTRTIEFISNYLEVTVNSPIFKSTKKLSLDDIQALEFIDGGNKDGPLGMLCRLGILDRYYIRIKAKNRFIKVHSETNRMDVENLYKQLGSRIEIAK